MEIRQRKLGSGRIGGKAAGMLLASPHFDADHLGRTV